MAQVRELGRPALRFYLFDFGWNLPLSFPRYFSVSSMVEIPTLELLEPTGTKKQVPAFY